MHLNLGEDPASLQGIDDSFFADLRWLKTVSSTYILTGRCNHSLSLDATIMVSKNCPTIGEHVVNIFVTQLVTIATVLLAKLTLNYSFRGL